MGRAWQRRAKVIFPTRAAYRFHFCGHRGRGGAGRQRDDHLVVCATHVQGIPDCRSCPHSIWLLPRHRHHNAYWHTSIDQCRSGHWPPADQGSNSSVCLVSAGAGDAEAQFTIGTLHGSGTHLKKDRKESLRWFEKAALQNDPHRGWIATGAFALPRIS